MTPCICTSSQLPKPIVAAMIATGSRRLGRFASSINARAKSAVPAGKTYRAKLIPFIEKCRHTAAMTAAQIVPPSPISFSFTDARLANNHHIKITTLTAAGPMKAIMITGNGGASNASMMSFIPTITASSNAAGHHRKVVPALAEVDIVGSGTNGFSVLMFQQLPRQTRDLKC